MHGEAKLREETGRVDRGEPPDPGSTAIAPLDDRRFRALIEHSYEAIAALAADGVIQYASPCTTRVLGYAPEEMVGRIGFELVHPEDLARVTADYREVLERPGAALRTELRLRHRDGSWRWIECAGTSLLDDPIVRS